MTAPHELKSTISSGAHAVSIVKAGAALVGHGAGPVRPPLSELKPAQVDRLGDLISRLGAQ